MLTDEILDEDIESLLYTQVYYGTTGVATPVTEDVPSTTNITKEIEKDTISEKLIIQNLDESQQVSSLPDCTTTISDTPIVNTPTEEINISLDETLTIDVPSTDKNPSVTPIQQDLEPVPASESSDLNPTQNPSNISADVPSVPPKIQQPISNITINQYIYPSDQFWDRLKDYRNVWSNRCKKDLKLLEKGILNEKQFFNKLKRRVDQQKKKLKKQELIRKAVFKRRQELFADNSVICLSDSDNSDVEFVGIEMNSNPAKKKNSKTVSVVENQSESDHDEVIYVEPPPVPIVNIDDVSDSDSDAENTNNKTETTQIPEPEEASNDFLVPTENSDKFNFSLHGSEFQDSEFVRPAIPHDNYDTESSTTSTSEFNRDSAHNNSVKTIVFNEVDFPREDMFQESDLEKFGDMITPSRSSNPENSGNNENKSNKSQVNTSRNETQSGSSSSESDYEPAANDPNLPDLCPMEMSEKKRDDKKTSKKTHDVNEEDSTETTPKKKSKHRADAMDCSASGKKKSKKKKKSASGTKDNSEPTSQDEAFLEDANATSILEYSPVAAEEPTRKKNKKKKRIIYEESDQPEPEPEPELDAVKKAGKKRKSKSLNTTAEEIPETEISGKKSKKRKQKSVSKDDQDSVLEELPEEELTEQMEIRDKELEPSEVHEEASRETEDVNDENNGRKSKKRKQKSPSSKDDQDNQEIFEEALTEQMKECEKGLEEPEVHEAVTKQTEDVNDEISGRKSKKRKQKSSSSKDDQDNQEIFEEEALTEQMKESEEGLEQPGMHEAVTKQTENVNDEISGKKSKKRKQKSPSSKDGQDNQEIFEEEGLTEQMKECEEGLEQPGVHEAVTKQTEDVNDEISGRKSKKRKQKSPSSKDDQDNQEIFEEEAAVTERVKEIEPEAVTKETGVDDDVVIIEQVIPVHTIESSDSEDNISIPEENFNLANVTAVIEDESNTSEFDLKNILNKMSDDPDKWKILPSDRYNTSPSKRGPRCNRCREVGHLAIYCPNKNMLPSCALCGLQGHMEPRCPNKVCFTCATPGNYSTVFCRKCVNRRNSSVCHVCKMAGHVGNSCPDLWRRYHLTTTTGDLNCPPRRKNVIIPRSKQWCSGCAGRGHLEHECNSYKWIKEYPSSSPHIFSYNNVYKSGQSRNKQRSNPDVSNQHQRRISDNRVEVTIGNHSIFVDDETPAEESSEVQPVENPPETTVISDTTAQTSEVVQKTPETVEEPSQPVPPRQDLVESSKPPDNPQPTSGGNLRRSPRKQRLNPFSVLNSRNPHKFTPYQRMLNPCSLMGGPPPAIPSLLDVVPFNIDTVRSAAINAAQPGFDHLYNTVPRDLLAQQILNLTSTVATNYQSSRQGDFFQGSQYSSMTSHVSPAVNFASDEPPNSFRDFSDPLLEKRYDEYTTFHTNYSPNQNYLDLPYTITSQHATPSANHYSNQTYHQSNFEDYRDSFKSLSICNVDEQTAKKFFNLSVSDLREFIRTEIEKIEKVKNSEPKVYKKKLNHIEQLKRSQHKTNSINKQIYFHYKHINMFLFGIRQLAEGHRNLDFLRNFVVNSGRDLQDQKRHSLLEAYGYIFGGEHPNFNYRKFLNIVSLGPKRGR